MMGRLGSDGDGDGEVQLGPAGREAAEVMGSPTSKRWSPTEGVHREPLEDLRPHARDTTQAKSQKIY